MSWLSVRGIGVRGSFVRGCAIGGAIAPEPSATFTARSRTFGAVPRARVF